jgi:hypothetical protein
MLLILFKINSNFTIHVWQEDNDRNVKILNKAILKRIQIILPYTDGDCIPRKDFVQHLKISRKGYFFQVVIINYQWKHQKLFLFEDIKSQNCFFTTSG